MASKPIRRAAKRDARIERGGRDADLRVGRRHRALGGSDVGPALENIGRHADRNRRRRHALHFRRQREKRRRRAGQRRDRVLELRALPAQHVDLRERVVDQRLLLRDVEARRGTQIVTRRDQPERAPLQLDRARQHVDLGVDLAQVEIRRGEVGRQQRAACFRDRRPTARRTRARLRSCAARGRRDRPRSSRRAKS